MLKIDIISGFLGAGKTTFIRRLLDTSLKNEKVILIENEYGEVSVDTDILNDTNIEIKELSQGCICCSLVGDFSKALNEIITKYNPDRILIEPSGVGKLSDVIKAVANANLNEYINSLVCLVDAKKAKMYNKNFGEFFVDQIESAHTIILSRTDVASEAVVETAVEIIRSHNDHAVVVTTPIATLSDEELLNAYEGVNKSLLDELKEEHEHHHHHEHDEECECGCHDHEHHHHHDEDDEECECGCHDHEHHHHEHEHHHHEHDEECECGCHDHEHHHHHDEDEECECGCHDHEHHHHHDEDEECECGCHDHEHHHHHDEDEECECGCHDHEHHHHHHHADEIFNQVGFETVKKYNMDDLKAVLDKMANGEYGIIVRAKGIVSATDGKWYVFNLTPEEVSVLETKAIPMGKIAVIGSHIDEEQIKALF